MPPRYDRVGRQRILPRGEQAIGTGSAAGLACLIRSDCRPVKLADQLKGSVSIINIVIGERFS